MGVIVEEVFRLALVDESNEVRSLLSESIGSFGDEIVLLVVLESMVEEKIRGCLANELRRIAEERESRR